jgi:hypothetical protein
MAGDRRLRDIMALSLAAALTPMHACLAAGTLRLDCRWSARFDTSTNQMSAAEGSASYTIDIRDTDEIEIRRADLAAPLVGRANAEQLSATTEYKIEGLSIQEFVAIHRRTGAIEAWTMMGEAGGAFMGRCSSAPTGP